MNIREISANDIFLWPDGTWCYRNDAYDYDHMSDDYEVIPCDTPRWDEIANG